MCANALAPAPEAPAMPFADASVIEGINPPYPLLLVPKARVLGANRVVPHPRAPDSLAAFNLHPQYGERVVHLRDQLLDPYEAIEKQWGDDHHMVCYSLWSLRDRCWLPQAPRVNLEAIPQLWEHGVAVLLTNLFADLDNDGHEPWPDGEAGLRAKRAMLDRLQAVPFTRYLQVHFTRAGLHLWGQPSEPIPIGPTRAEIDTAEAIIGGFLCKLQEVGFNPDFSCTDVSRLMRLPRVRRDGVVQDHSGSVYPRPARIELADFEPRFKSRRRDATVGIEWVDADEHTLRAEQRRVADEERAARRAEARQRSREAARDYDYEVSRILGVAPGGARPPESAVSAAAVQRASGPLATPLPDGRMRFRRVVYVRSDWSTVNLVDVMQRLGFYIGPLGDGRHATRCPWEHEHTIPGHNGSDTVVFAGGVRHIFHCSHAHCAGRGNAAIRELDPRLFDEHCEQLPWTAASGGGGEAETADALESVLETESDQDDASRSPQAPFADVAGPDAPPSGWKNRDIAGFIAADPARSLLSLSRRVCMCGRMDLGWRTLRSRETGAITKAPFACKSWLCPNCTHWKSQQLILPYQRVTSKRVMVGRSWHVFAGSPALAIQAAFRFASELMKSCGSRRRKGTPERAMARWIRLNNADIKPAGQESRVTIAVLYELPGVTWDHSDEQIEAAKTRDNFGADIAAYYMMQAASEPRVSRDDQDMVQWMERAISGVPWWVSDVPLVVEVVNAIKKKKLYLANKRMHAWLPETEEPEQEMIGFGCDLDALDAAPIQHSYPVLRWFVKQAMGVVMGTRSLPVEFLRDGGKTRVGAGEVKIIVMPKYEKRFRQHVESKAAQDDPLVGIFDRPDG